MKLFPLRQIHRKNKTFVSLQGPKSCVFGGAVSEKERAPLRLSHPTPRRHSNPDEAAGFDAVSNTPTAVDGVVLLRSRIFGLKLIV